MDAEADVTMGEKTLSPLLPTPNLPPLQPQTAQRKTQYIAAFSACLGALGMGTALGWTSPALPYLSSSNSTHLDEPLTAEQGAWVGSLLAIGAIVGSIPTGYFADAWGRKLTIIGLSLPSLLSWVLIVFGRSAWLIYIARLLAGFSMGGFSVVSPMYTGEIADVSIRGGLGSYFEFFICSGIMVVYIVGAIADYIWLGVLMGIIPVASMIVFFFMPDTPSYYLMKGDRIRAEAALQYFRGPKYDIAPEILIIQKELEEAKLSSTSIRQLLSSRANLNALLIAFGLMLAQQLSGVNIVIFYTADMFRAAGSEISPDICAVIIGIVQAVSVYVSVLLVDRAGRRILLLLSATLSLLCLLTLGTFFHLRETDPETAAAIGWLPLTAVNVFVIAIALGLGPIPWMMLGELFSSSFKGIATSASCLLNNVLVFFVAKTYVNFMEAFGIAGAFWFYAIVTFILIVFMYFKVPETKGKSFLEIQAILAKK